ncbi:MAG: LysM peptidoglycan-binding domain-containing protein [Leptothrix sp. (in: b-proteobacteria)]
MILSRRPTGHHSRHSALRSGVLGIALLAAGLCAAHAAPNYPITAGQRGTARQVAEAGVPISELAPDAPERYTVKHGDTLWDISKLFLRSPWHWPELWGMNLEQIRNPHLIYPGQVLVLVRGSNGRALLQAGEVPGSVDATGRLSPRARSTGLDLSAISAVPLHLIKQFLTDAVVLDTNELDSAPRIVAGRDDRVLLGRGDTAYVRGELVERKNWRVFREAHPLQDPDSHEILGYEAVYVGTAEYVRRGEVRRLDADHQEIVPASFLLTDLRQEAGQGDRLAPATPNDDSPYVPHAPAQPIAGRVISVYGDALSAGQNQIVALNKGRRDGMERGHVMAVVRAGEPMIDRSDPLRAELRLPDERNGHLFVFRIFERVSYALILSAQTPVRAGDRFVEP